MVHQRRDFKRDKGGVNRERIKRCREEREREEEEDCIRNGKAREMQGREGEPIGYSQKHKKAVVNIYIF